MKYLLLLLLVIFLSCAPTMVKTDVFKETKKEKTEKTFEHYWFGVGVICLAGGAFFMGYNLGR